MEDREENINAALNALLESVNGNKHNAMKIIEN
jgi:hypothetical protein